MTESTLRTGSRRLLYCHPGAELYGSDRMAAATVEGLVADGWAVDVVVPENGPLVTLFQKAGARVRVLPIPVLRKSALRPRGLAALLFSLPRAAGRMWRAIGTSDAEVVVVNTITQPWWMAVGRLRRRRVVAHVREAEDTLPVPLQRILLAPLAFANVVLANSRATAQHLATRGPRISGRLSVVYNGKDWDPYFRTEPRDLDDEPRLLFVGRISPRKGPDLAIAALKRIHAAGVRAHLTLVGSVFPGYEWYEDELVNAVKAADLVDYVDFAGFQSDTIGFFERSDIVLVPSRIEPFGTVAAEAMASMRPTVVSDVQGLIEIVSDHSVGRVVPADSADALAEACLELIRDPATARDIAARGMESVRDRFSVTQYRRGVALAVDVDPTTERGGDE